MGGKTKIEWTKGDDGSLGATWNPIRGCSRVSAGCQNCYAERQAARFSGPGQPYEGLIQITSGGPRWSGKVAFVEKHLEDPIRWTRPRRVFVNSMSDLFHEEVTNEQIAVIFGVMAAARKHTFQVLTKRAKRMREWFGWAGSYRDGGWCSALWDALSSCWGLSHPIWGGEADEGDGLARVLDVDWPLPNVHLGVSVEDQPTADERVPELLATPAAVRFVSYEPALGPIDFTPWMPDGYIGASVEEQRRAIADGRDPHALPMRRTRGWPERGVVEEALGWAIVGGESGPNARPFDVAWARATIAAYRASGVPCFVKQLGARPGTFKDVNSTDGTPGFFQLRLRDPKGGDPSEWPADLRVREFPRTEAPR